MQHNIKRRLLPLVLDAPRLLKNKADPSALALQMGLTAPLPPPPNQASTVDQQPPNSNGQSETLCTPLGIEVEPLDELGEAMEEAAPQQAACDDAEGEEEAALYRLRLARGLRLFSLYVAAGGALCMRQTVWRKLMPALHPDKGGDTRVFQLVNELKRRLDRNEEVELPSYEPLVEGDESDGLYERIKEELRVAAAGVGEGAVEELARVTRV